MTEDSDKPLDTKISRYIKAVVFVLLPMPFIALSATLTLLRGQVPWMEIVISLPFLAYYGTSIERVKANYVGGIFVLERYAWEVGPFYYFVPRGICKLGVLPVSFNQEQFPGDPERISKRSDEHDLNGMLRPFRIPTAGSEPGSGDDPLRTRMTLEPTASVVWRLARKGFFEMWIRIPGDTWEEKYANIVRQMYDSLHSMLGKSLAKRTPVQLYENLEEVDKELKAALVKALKKFGVQIDRVEMQPPPPPHRVNIALAEISEALARKQAGITKAEEEKQSEILRQEGVAQGRERLSEADRIERKNRGVGDMEAATALGISGKEHRNGELGVAALSKSTVIAGPDGVAQVLALGKVLTAGDKKGEAS